MIIEPFTVQFWRNADVNCIGVENWNVELLMTFAAGSSTGQIRASCLPKSRPCRLILFVAFSLCIFPPVVHSTVYMAHQCGRTIRSAGDMIFSQGGLYYTSNTNCTVTIETPNNEGYVLLQFTEMDLKSNENCTDDYIELTHVRGKNSLGDDVTRQMICGEDAPKEVVSIGSFLQIHLISDGHRNGRGWSGVFTTVLTSGGSLCLGHDRYRCGNGRCIASSLRCDSVNHCGDASDERGSCQDDLPEYISQHNLVDGRKALYVVLGIIFTIFFICVCTVQCVRDTVVKIQRRIKLIMKSRKKKNEAKKTITPEDELRQTLMASLYDRRASQPYEVTLNTITGGELARQLKLHLQQDKTDSNVNRASETANEPDSVKVINFQSRRLRNLDEGVTDKSEVLSLLQNESHDTNSDSWDFDYTSGFNLPSEKSGSTKSIPSVIVSEDGDDSHRLVIFDPNENPAELSVQNTQPKTSPSKTPASRFQVRTVPESKVSSKNVFSTSSSFDTSAPSKSRFSVRSKSEQPTSGKGTAVSFSPAKSRFAVTVVDENKDDKGVNLTNHQRSKDAPTATGRFLEVPRVRRGSGGEQKSDTLQVSPPKTSRFTVQKIEEDEQSGPKSKNIFEKLEQTHRNTNRDYTKQFSDPNTLTSPFQVRGDNANEISRDGNVITTSVTVHGFPGFISVRSWDSATRRPSYETHL